MSNVSKKEEERSLQINEVLKENEDTYRRAWDEAKKEKEAQFIYSSKSPRVDPVKA